VRCGECFVKVDGVLLMQQSPNTELINSISNFTGVLR
jgi:hypothetical protein